MVSAYPRTTHRLRGPCHPNLASHLVLFLLSAPLPTVAADGYYAVNPPKKSLCRYQMWAASLLDICDHGIFVLVDAYRLLDSIQDNCYDRDLSHVYASLTYVADALFLLLFFIVFAYKPFVAESRRAASCNGRHKFHVC